MVWETEAVNVQEFANLCRRMRLLSEEWSSELHLVTMDGDEVPCDRCSRGVKRGVESPACELTVRDLTHS
jgi:hypothetical protein